MSTAALAVSCGVNRLSAAPIGGSTTTPETAPPAAPDKNPPEVQDAIKRFEGGDAATAYELLKKAAAKYPQLSPPRVMLASLYLTDNQRAAGLEQLEGAAQDYPDDPEPHLIFADIGVVEHRYSDAAEQYRAADELLKTFHGDAGRQQRLVAQYYLGIAAVARGHKQWEQAQKDLEKLLELQPGNATAHERLASVLFARQKPEAALAELQATVKADPRRPPVGIMMASLYRDAGDYKSTEKWLRQAVSDVPSDLRPRLALGRWLFDEGDIDGAAKQFKAAEQLDAKSPDVRLMLGTILRFRKDYGQSQRYLDALVDEFPANVAAIDQLALTLAEQSDPAKLHRAADLATMNLKAGPQNPEAASTLARICYRQGKLDEADHYFAMALRGGNASRDTAYFLAKFLFDRGQRDRAKQLLRQAIDGHGPFAHLDDAKSWAAELGKKETAPQ